MTETELELIEEVLEQEIADEFMFEELNNGLHFKICMFVAEKLEFEYGITRPFQVKFVEPDLRPIVVICD